MLLLPQISGNAYDTVKQLNSNVQGLRENKSLVAEERQLCDQIFLFQNELFRHAHCSPLIQKYIWQHRRSKLPRFSTSQRCGEMCPLLRDLSTFVDLDP